MSWAGGAIWSRHVFAEGSALLPVSRQMMSAGAILIAAGCLHGDVQHLDLADTRLTAWLGFAYLVLIGSLGGYPVYIWLMRICPASKVATISYMNLLVAIFLGWSLGHETITLRWLAGTAIVLGSVAIVLRSKGPEVVPPGD
jgi:drug/metabolite transporter (DMT)-like permease